MKTKKLTHLAMLITFALVIHTVESALPMPIPGAKLGLANVITLLTFVLYGLGAAMFVSVCRTLLGSMFAGTFLAIGFYLSFSGAIVSTLIMAVGMYFWRRGKISLIAVSVLGAVAHNTTQVVVASAIIGNANLIRLYLPILLLLALPTGFFTGLAVMYSQKALTKIITDLERS
ncbi:MAG TPA: heptaprenyl diphosphate synthase [Firmicutes bacterium]|jgi:heptaprenyl diphosphate synthase|nr:Gx transporter family protein [Bacillota bacterium]HAA37743.1 heptaprenyl diphosphate synthase [Bacillota bacterium]